LIGWQQKHQKSVVERSDRYGLSQSKRLVGGNSRRNSISGGPRGVVSRTGGISCGVNTPYGGLLIRAGADKRAGRAFFKFATKLFSKRAGHASARVREDCIDGSDAPVVQAEPGESGRASEQRNHRYGFNRNSTYAEFGQLLGAQCKHGVGKESNVFCDLWNKYFCSYLPDKRCRRTTTICLAARFWN
jgi:hypothetical protein